jgi:hypothetical protein
MKKFGNHWFRRLVASVLAHGFRHLYIRQCEIRSCLLSAVLPVVWPWGLHESEPVLPPPAPHSVTLWSILILSSQLIPSQCFSMNVPHQNCVVICYVPNPSRHPPVRLPNSTSWPVSCKSQTVCSCNILCHDCQWNCPPLLNTGCSVNHVTPSCQAQWTDIAARQPAEHLDSYMEYSSGYS